MTKKQKFADFHDAMKCLKREEKPRRLNGRAKDGSLPTKPAIEIANPKSERDVLDECKAWLEARGCMVNRLNNGSFCTAGGWRRYGILGGGDLLGCTRDGRHFEIEVKKGRGGRLRVEQQRRRDKCLAHNAIYLVVHDVEELEFLWPE